MRDVFLCHSSDDKIQYVHPIVEASEKKDISYWIDEAEIKWGEKITNKINEGLAISRFVIVFITDSFLEKNWPNTELETALHVEIDEGRTFILPLLIAPSEKVFQKYPLLRSKLYLRWDIGIDSIMDHLDKLIWSYFPKKQPDKEPDFFKAYTYIIRTGLGKLTVIINEHEERPYGLLASIGKSGRSTTAKCEAIGRLVSLAFRHNIDVSEIVEELKGIGGEHPIFQNGGLVLSIPDAIARVLEKHYLKKEKIDLRDRYL